MISIALPSVTRNVIVSSHNVSLNRFFCATFPDDENGLSMTSMTYRIRSSFVDGKVPHSSLLADSTCE